MSARLARCLACLSALLLMACQAPGAQPLVPPTGPAPEGCGPDFPRDAPLLELEPTQAPAPGPARKGQPYTFASTIRVDRDLAGAGHWTDFDDGWSSLALRIASPGAKSLSLHLTQATLPTRTHVWFCSADGRVRQGPYRDAVGGELWTPMVPGSEARLEIILQTIDKERFTARLADVSGGFR